MKTRLGSVVVPENVEPVVQPTPLRVLHLIPSLDGGGAERQLALLSIEHVRSGYDVHVAVLREGGHAAAVADGGVRVHVLRAAGNYDPLIVARIVGLIRELQPDIVQTWLTQMDILGGLAVRITRTPWILSERSCAAAYPRSIKNALRRWVSSRSAAIASNSPGGDEYWRAIRGEGMRRAVIPNGIDMDAISATEPAAHMPFAAADTSPWLLFAGRLSAEKNVNGLLDALELLGDRLEFNALLCGDGPDRDRLDRRIRLSSLHGRVFLHGYTPDLWRLMKRVSIFVAPTLFEGNPNTVLEAMACGCWLVVSDIPAHRAFLDDTVATLVDPRDPVAIAAGVLEAIVAPAKARARALSAAQRVRRFSPARMAEAYGALYGEVAYVAANARSGRAPSTKVKQEMV